MINFKEKKGFICDMDDAVIIGDRMDTDIVAGTETGVQTVLVLSGVSNENTPKKYAYQPTMILDGVGDIVKCAEKDDQSGQTN